MSKSKTTWKERMFAAADGTQTGAIVRAAFGEYGPAMRFDRKATVTSDGFIMCGFTRENGEYHMGAFVGALDDLVVNVVGLGRHCKLTAEQFAELSVAVGNWLGRELTSMKLH
jgi:hypothetical protein